MFPEPLRQHLSIRGMYLYKHVQLPCLTAAFAEDSQFIHSLYIRIRISHKLAVLPINLESRFTANINSNIRFVSAFCKMTLFWV